MNEVIIMTFHFSASGVSSKAINIVQMKNIFHVKHHFSK